MTRFVNIPLSVNYDVLGSKFYTTLTNIISRWILQSISNVLFILSCIFWTPNQYLGTSKSSSMMQNQSSENYPVHCEYLARNGYDDSKWSLGTVFSASQDSN